jgi:hypothetical protein
MLFHSMMLCRTPYYANRDQSITFNECKTLRITSNGINVNSTELTTAPSLLALPLAAPLLSETTSIGTVEISADAAPATDGSSGTWQGSRENKENNERETREEVQVPYH